MALSHKQVDTFLSGTWHESKSIKDDWKDIYGEEDPQAAIDELYELINNTQDVMLSYTHEQKIIEQTLRSHVRIITMPGGDK